MGLLGVGLFINREDSKLVGLLGTCVFGKLTSPVFRLKIGQNGVNLSVCWYMEETLQCRALVMRPGFKF